MNSLSELKTVDEDGIAPESRLNDATEVVSLVTKLVGADEKRAIVRKEVKGLCDGNPPFRAGDLIRAGQSYRHNVNWRIAESFLSNGQTAYWDVISEGPTMATITTSEGDSTQRGDWSQIITEEFDNLNKADPELNYMFQKSQYHMTLWGMGPVIWEDEFDFRSKAVPNVLVPDGEPSNVNEWQVCVVPMEYPADKLYSFIRGTAAEKRGWNKAAVIKALILSVPQGLWKNVPGDKWAWLQQRLRNNDLSTSAVCDVIPVAHVFYREFPQNGERCGKISHCIVSREHGATEFLFRKVRRYDNWRQVVAPFYYDVGDGTHHSVKGLGVKAFGALDAYNRLQCSIVDAATFHSAMHIQATTENMRQKASVIPMGPFNVWPAGFTVLPNVNSTSQLEGPIAVKQDLINTVTSNLAQYRQGLQEKQGNPITATEMSYRAETESTITRTQLTRYFDQCDEFFAERYRRAANPISPHPEAKEFQKKCKDRGVPASALKNAIGKMTRTVGYGSAYNRLASLNRMLSMIGMLPENGQRKLLEDVTSAQVGHSLMRRYIPEQPKQFNNDRVIAALQVAAAKIGIPPEMPEDVNHAIFAETFLVACAQAAEGLSQGADPVEVLTLIDTIAPSIYQHIDAMRMDPSKKEAVKELEKQFGEIAKVADKLREMIGQQQEQQAEDQQKMQQAQAIQQGMDPDTQIKAAETQAKLQMAAQKNQQAMQIKDAKARQDMAIADMKTAKEMSKPDKPASSK